VRFAGESLCIAVFADAACKVLGGSTRAGNHPPRPAYIHKPRAGGPVLAEVKDAAGLATSVLRRHIFMAPLMMSADGAPV
jgi:hypothetical protein